MKVFSIVLQERVIHYSESISVIFFSVAHARELHVHQHLSNDNVTNQIRHQARVCSLGVVLVRVVFVWLWNLTHNSFLVLTKGWII